MRETEIVSHKIRRLKEKKTMPNFNHTPTGTRVATIDVDVTSNYAFIIPKRPQVASAHENAKSMAKSDVSKQTFVSIFHTSFHLEKLLKSLNAQNNSIFYRILNEMRIELLIQYELLKLCQTASTNRVPFE